MNPEEEMDYIQRRLLEDARDAVREGMDIEVVSKVYQIDQEKLVCPSAEPPRWMG